MRRGWEIDGEHESMGLCGGDKQMGRRVGNERKVRAMQKEGCFTVKMSTIHLSPAFQCGVFYVINRYRR